jgi:hypothetical protein
MDSSPLVNGVILPRRRDGEKGREERRRPSFRGEGVHSPQGERGRERRDGDISFGVRDTRTSEREGEMETSPLRVRGKSPLVTLGELLSILTLGEVLPYTRGSLPSSH